MYGVPFPPTQGPKETEPTSRFQQFKKTPIYPVLCNGVLFAAGVWFIQSPLMDLLNPQYV